MNPFDIRQEVLVVVCHLGCYHAYARDNSHYWSEFDVWKTARVFCFFFYKGIKCIVTFPGSSGTKSDFLP